MDRDHVGAPLTEGLITVRNALVGASLRDGSDWAPAEVATGADMIKRMAQDAD
jgi:glutamate synthase domain-containing protein 2